MPLFAFLAEIMQRFGLVFHLEPFYFAAVQAIGFLPRDQIETIMRLFGHAVSGPVCGLTMMRDDGQFHRTVPQIWIAEPDAACQVRQLPAFLAHELRHAYEWIANGLTVWPGHE